MSNKCLDGHLEKPPSLPQKHYVAYKKEGEEQAKGSPEGERLGSAPQKEKDWAMFSFHSLVGVLGSSACELKYPQRNKTTNKKRHLC